MEDYGGGLNTYVFKGPGGIDEWLDLSFAPQREHALDGAAHVVSAAMLEQQVAQVQTGQALVLVEKLDGRHLVYLPPLEHTYTHILKIRQFTKNMLWFAWI